MGVQKKILTKELDGETFKVEVPKAGGTSEIVTLALQGGVGTLALGKPGDIWSRAYGPLAYASGSLNADATFGTFVAGKGILVNGNDVANMSPTLEASTTLKAGQVGSFLAAGAAVVFCRDLANIKAGYANCRVLLGYDASLVEQYAMVDGPYYDDVCVVEVNGVIEGGDSSQS